jgi:hypothetical protein
MALWKRVKECSLQTCSPVGFLKACIIMAHESLMLSRATVKLRTASLLRQQWSLVLLSQAVNWVELYYQTKLNCEKQQNPKLIDRIWICSNDTGCQFIFCGNDSNPPSSINSSTTIFGLYESFTHEGPFGVICVNGVGFCHVFTACSGDIAMTYQNLMVLIQTGIDTLISILQLLQAVKLVSSNMTVCVSPGIYLYQDKHCLRMKKKLYNRRVIIVSITTAKVIQF